MGWCPTAGDDPLFPLIDDQHLQVGMRGVERTEVRMAVVSVVVVLRPYRMERIVFLSLFPKVGPFRSREDGDPGWCLSKGMHDWSSQPASPAGAVEQKASTSRLVNRSATASSNAVATYVLVRLADLDVIICSHRDASSQVAHSCGQRCLMLAVSDIQDRSRCPTGDDVVQVSLQRGLGERGALVGVRLALCHARRHDQRCQHAAPERRFRSLEGLPILL